MILEEQLKVISKEVSIYLSCGKNEYLGCKDSFLLENLYLDKEVKNIKASFLENNNEIEAVLQIEVEEWA